MAGTAWQQEGRDPRQDDEDEDARPAGEVREDPVAALLDGLGGWPRASVSVEVDSWASLGGRWGARAAARWMPVAARAAR